MATLHLTKRSVDALEFTPGCDYFVWDSALKGFGVRVTERTDAGGQLRRRKVFLVGYRPAGVRTFRRFTIGAFGRLTVDQARRAAQTHLAAVSQGADPIEARRVLKTQQTVRDLGTAYLADVAARRKPSTAKEYARLWERHVVPSLGTKMVAAVVTADVRRLHRSMNATPYLANRVIAMLGGFFTFAAHEGAVQGENPAHGIEFYPEVRRERFLTAEEFRRLGIALVTAEREGLPPAPQHRRTPGTEARRKHTPAAALAPLPANPLAVAAIRLLALTGCREGEVLSLRWDALDLENGYLRLADTKTGKSNRPLGESAASLVQSLPRVAGCPYVFPGNKPGTHLKELKRLWFAVRHAAGLDGLRIHDLRHSFASVPAIGGESMLVLRTLLGHSRVATTERYAHLSADPVRRAADRASGDIAGWLAGAETPVTQFRSAR